MWELGVKSAFVIGMVFGGLMLLSAMGIGGLLRDRRRRNTRRTKVARLPGLTNILN